MRVHTTSAVTATNTHLYPHLDHTGAPCHGVQWLVVPTEPLPRSVLHREKKPGPGDNGHGELEVVL